MTWLSESCDFRYLDSTNVVVVVLEKTTSTMTTATTTKTSVSLLRVRVSSCENVMNREPFALSWRSRTANDERERAKRSLLTYKQMDSDSRTRLQFAAKWERSMVTV